MTAAEQNLHDIVNSFTRLSSVVREVCPQCNGRGLVITDHQVERCTSCAATGFVTVERNVP